MATPSLAKTAVDLALDTSFPVRRRLTGRRLILCYHRVRAETTPPTFDDPVTCLPRRVFSHQIAWLSRFADIRPLDALVSDPTPPPRGRWQVAITFDDGYADTLEVALPLLVEAGLPATVFVATDYVEDPDRVPWWDVAAAVAARRSGRIPVEASDLDATDSATSPHPGGLDLACDRDRAWLIDRLAACGRTTGWPPLARTVAGHLCADGAAPLRNAFARPEAVAAAARLPGITIAPHTASHPVLSALSADAQRQEIEHARARLSAWGIPATPWFAYPFGHPDSFNADTRSVLSALGFAGAVTTRPGTLGPDSDRLALPRIDIDARWSARRFRARVGAADLTARLR